MSEHEESYVNSYGMRAVGGAREVDYAKLDPGIRETVRWCNDNGFRTTDSGDGISKPEDHRTIEGPHVVIRVESQDDLVTETDRLADELGITERSLGITIEATYSPIDKVPLIILRGYTDAELEGE